jgi:uncharacterized protein involved in exopolysaccharide biosynthesis
LTPQSASNVKVRSRHTPEQKQRLEAAAQTAKRAYETFLSLTRYTQNTAERAFPVTEARIMSPALPPLTRTSPNTPLVVGLSLLAGCFLGVALTLAGERFDHSIRTRRAPPTFLEADRSLLTSQPSAVCSPARSPLQWRDQPSRC